MNLELNAHDEVIDRLLEEAMAKEHFMNNPEALVSSVLFRFLKPDKRYSIREWADAYRILPAGNSEAGPYRTSRVPYMKGIYAAMDSDSGIDEVWVMKGAQLGMSEAANNIIGSWIANSPGHIMAVQPTVVMAKEYAQQRIDTMIHSTPVLSQKVVPPRSRYGSNTSRLKEFPGGFLNITGANSASGLSSKPIKYLILDEVDRYPADVDGQGDPVKLAMQRLSTYARSKVFAISTPTTQGGSRIEKALAQYGYQQYFMPCPHCGEFITFELGQMKWDEGDPESVRAACQHCGALIDESHKTAMMEAGEWRDVVRPLKSSVRCFQINAFYSPVGWRHWSDIIHDYEEGKRLQARGDDKTIKAFFNLDLGLPYEEAQSIQSIETLKMRRESWTMGNVPDGAVVLTAGVDVQGNRVEALLVGWGPGEESWIIESRVFYGDPADGAVWRALDEWLVMPRIGKDGGQYTISAVGIDSGYLPQSVYDFCRTRGHRTVIATKGSSQPGKPLIGRPSKVDVLRGGRMMRGGASVWSVGTDTGKTTIYARLALKVPGPGYIHFPADADDELLMQIISERVVVRYVRGFPRREWVKDPAVRNEALDCFNYAMAVAHLIGVHRFGAAEWQRRSVMVRPAADLFNGGFDVARDNAQEENQVRRSGWESSRKESYRARSEGRPRKGGWL